MPLCDMQCSTIPNSVRRGVSTAFRSIVRKSKRQPAYVLPSSAATPTVSMHVASAARLGLGPWRVHCLSSQQSGRHQDCLRDIQIITTTFVERLSAWHTSCGGKRRGSTQARHPSRRTILAHAMKATPHRAVFRVQLQTCSSLDHLNPFTIINASLRKSSSVSFRA